MGYRPPMPPPDQDEPETWASWDSRRRRPAVHFQEDEQPEPEAPVAAWCFFGIIVVLLAFLVAKNLGVL